MSPLNNHRLFSPPSGPPQRTELQGVSRCTHWARCIAESHKRPALSHIPGHIEREDAEKTRHQGDTSGKWGRPFHCEHGVWGRERSAGGHPNMLREGCLGNPGQGISTAGRETFRPRSKVGWPAPARNQLSLHYTASSSSFWRRKMTAAIHPKGQSLGNLVNKQNYGKR